MDLAFAPDVVHDTLYSESCEQAFRTIYDVPITAKAASNFVKLIMGIMFSQTISSGRAIAAYHRKNLKTTEISWAEIKSNRICLSCIRRAPELMLTCGYSIYEVCLQIFDQSIPDTPYRFGLDECVICDQSEVCKTVMPSTAGSRVLSVNEGDVEDVVPLEFLAKI